MNSGFHVTRFMILGSARTGSNLLLSLLTAHPAIKTYGELFNLERLPRENLREALEDPILFLRRRLYETHAPDIATVGFKMFYDHLTKSYFDELIDLSEVSPGLRDRMVQFSSFIRSNYEWHTLDERFQRAWRFLQADRSLVIVHLKRRNMLHTLISLKMAFRTNRWWNLKCNLRATTPVHLDPQECCRYFHMIERCVREADEAFSGHPCMEVFYEDLAEKQDDTMRKIFAFLGLPCVPVNTRMKKQILAAPWEAVDNYNELRSYFMHTRWELLFE
jgi:LPS sulfotransferase NodH